MTAHEMANAVAHRVQDLSGGYSLGQEIREERKQLRNSFGDNEYSESSLHLIGQALLVLAVVRHRLELRQ